MYYLTRYFPLKQVTCLAFSFVRVKSNTKRSSSHFFAFFKKDEVNSYLIFMTSEIRLIALYDFIYEVYNTELTWQCQRFSPSGHQGFFTDEQLLTCYLFSMLEEEKFLVKKSYKFIQKYWIAWFPNLPSYKAFNKRLNRLDSVFSELVSLLVNSLLSMGYIGKQREGLLDSFPIQLSSGKRKSKVAPGLSVKGYCATKKLYYHGVKCQVLGLSGAGTIPTPAWINITPLRKEKSEFF